MSKKYIIISIILTTTFLLWRNFLFSFQENTPSFPVTHYQLKNGLHVILSEDYSLPVVSVVVAYQVGSINESPGKSGLAYLLENLMFQGSENIGPMHHIKFINRMGGELNALTTQEKTLFYQKVPSNQLAPVLWLESERMRSLKITSSKVNQAKKSILEEIKYRTKNNPYLETSLYFDQIIFPHFIYYHPIFGLESDVREITLEDVKEFYSTYYIPNNAVLCIVGNINKIKCRKMVERYFAQIPPGEDIPSLSLHNFSLEEQITETVVNPMAPSPAFYLGYRLPSPYSDYFYPLKLIQYLLVEGNTSRLYKRLIEKEHIATNLEGNIKKKKNLAVFEIFVLTNNEITKEMCRKAVFSEINKLKYNVISEKELQKIKNMFRRDYVNQYSTTTDKAIFLTEKFLERKNLSNLQNELNKFLSVSAEQIQRIINKYFDQHYFMLNVKIK